MPVAPQADKPDMQPEEPALGFQGPRLQPPGPGPAQRWDRLLEGQARILEMLVGESDPTRILDGICRLIEAFDPEMMASVLLLDPDGTTVHKGAAPSLPSGYSDLLEGLSIGPSAGSCGTAMYRREQVIVTDIASDPLWAPYKDLALPFGLRACWSTPIFSAQGKVEGSFALYFREPKAPSAEDLRLVAFAARLTGVAVGRARDHRRLEEALFQLDEARRAAEQASEAKSRFLASMSHELRTPLTAILLYTELMGQEQHAGSLQEDLGKIQSAGQHLLSLVNSILDLSKIEAGAMTVEREPVELEGLLEDLGGILRPLVEAKGNRLDIRRDAGLRVLCTDPLKLRQVLYNLIGNACKFTERGVISLMAEAAPGEARFSVRDTGIGMNEEELGRLFQEFSQAGPHTARRYGGTGLGLTICQRLVDLLGGRIEVQSRPQEGTTFILHFPDGMA